MDHHPSLSMSNVSQYGQPSPFGTFEGSSVPSHNATAGPSTFRGGARGRRGAMSGRGAAPGKPFGNRSAVFNTSYAQTNTVPLTGVEAVASDTRAAAAEVDMPSSSFIGHDVGKKMPVEPEEERKRRFENLPAQNRFFEMRAQREALRARYIQEGVLPDPDKPTDLAEAIALKGTCMEMCPEFEREEREFQNEGDVLEMFPGTTRIDPRIAVKIYRRPAAGRELPLPEDIRPPDVLCRTLDYLVHDLLPADPSSSVFTNVQPFMWNRTRAIRQDFIVQGEWDALAIECHERIARYHILCLHWRGGVGAEGWSEQQELEQLRKTIRSLTEFYQDARRKEGRSSPNEPEFRAYNLLLHMHDPETLREVEGLDMDDAPIIQAALKLRAFAQRSNNVIRRGRPLNTEATMNLWTRFFGELRRNRHVTYLLACLAENAFSSVRAGALKAMGKTYLSQHAPLSLEFLQRTLGMDTVEQARTFAVELGAVEAFSQTGQLLGVRLGKINDDKPLPVAPFSANIVEAKRGHLSCQDVIDGKASNAAPLAAHTVSKAPANVLKGSVVKSSFLLPSESPPSMPPIKAQSAFALAPTPPVASAAPLAIPKDVVFNATQPSISSTISDSAQQLSKHPPPAPASTNLSPFASPFVPIIQPLTEAKPPSSGFSFAAPPQVSKSLPEAVKEQSKQFENLPSLSEPPLASESQPAFSAAKEVAPPPPAPRPASIAKPLPKSSPPPKVTPKRTVASLAYNLMQDLVNEVVERKVSTIAEQACLREVRIRQKTHRDSTVKRGVQYLQDRIWDEILDEALLKAASESLADEQHSRVKKKRSWKSWQTSLTRVREQAQQTARLHAIRSKIRTKTSDIHPHTIKDSSRTSAMDVDVREDQVLRRQLVHAQEDRSDVWRSSTFLLSIVQRTTSVLALGMDRWTVGLDTASSDAPSSVWLQVKFGIDQEPHAEVALRTDLCIHAMDIARCYRDAERDLGLLVFELSSDQDAHSADWEKNRQRMASIVDSDLVQQSRYRPKLLIVSWQPCDRKSILSQLQLRATDGMRYNWSEVEIWQVGGKGHEEILADFESHVDELLQIPPKLQQRVSISFDDVLTVCTWPWRQAMERLEACMHRMSRANLNAEPSLDVALLAFNTATFLVNRVIDDVIGVSELVADENVDLDSAAMPMPSIKARSHTVDAKLYSAAFSQVALLVAHQSAEVGSYAQLLKAWLSEAQASSKHFPWLEYFVRLLHIGLLHVQRSWIEATLPTLQEIQLQIDPSSQLYAHAAEEIEYKSKGLLQKRGRISNAMEDRPAAKIRRMRDSEGEQMEIDIPVVRSTENASIGSLRSLVAGARELLAHRQEAEV